MPFRNYSVLSRAFYLLFDFGHKLSLWCIPKKKTIKFKYLAKKSQEQNGPSKASSSLRIKFSTVEDGVP